MFFGFSTLQRAEIAEIARWWTEARTRQRCFSTLQRAEIAEIFARLSTVINFDKFQYSSTSRNC